MLSVIINFQLLSPVATHKATWDAEELVYAIVLIVVPSEAIQMNFKQY